MPRCRTTRAIEHRSMVPPEVKGEVMFAAPDGEYTIEDTIVTIRKEDGTEEDLEAGAALADPCAETFRRQVFLPQTACHRAEDLGYDVPHCQGRNCGDPGRIWYRKDDDTAPDCQVV